MAHIEDRWHWPGPDAGHPYQGRYRLTPAAPSTLEQSVSALRPDSGRDRIEGAGENR